MLCQLAAAATAAPDLAAKLAAGTPPVPPAFWAGPNCSSLRCRSVLKRAALLRAVLQQAWCSRLA